jgi:ribonuclease PH
MRSLKVVYDIYSYAAGSVLFEIGDTKVLASVSIQNSTPHFLKGKRKGWLTAEYSLLPASTPFRTMRESSINKKNGRTIEISRFIGRVLRSIVDLSVLEEKTLFIDCDILQAAGGTRTACITAAYLALRSVEKKLLASGIISIPFLLDEIASISVGSTVKDDILLDMDFSEDNIMSSDYNFVFLRKEHKVVEVQGTALLAPISWEEVNVLKDFALQGALTVFSFYDENTYIPSNQEDSNTESYYKSCNTVFHNDFL